MGAYLSWRGDCGGCRRAYSTVNEHDLDGTPEKLSECGNVAKCLEKIA